MKFKWKHSKRARRVHVNPDNHAWLLPAKSPYSPCYQSSPQTHVRPKLAPFLSPLLSLLQTSNHMSLPSMIHKSNFPMRNAIFFQHPLHIAVHYGGATLADQQGFLVLQLIHSNPCLAQNIPIVASRKVE